MSRLAQSLSQSLSTPLSNSLSGGVELLVRLGTFANASYPRYMLAKNLAGVYAMTSQASANVPLTRNIGGHTYIQMESEFATENTYTEVFRAAISDWTNNAITVSDDNAQSPIGDDSADTILETTANDTHHVRQAAFTPDGSSIYYAIAFGRYNNRAKCHLRISGGGFAGVPQCYFNLSTGAPYSDSDTVDYGILDLGNDLYCIYVAGLSDAASGTQCTFYLVDDSDNFTYIGDTSKKVDLWGFYVVKAEHWINYIKAVASPVTKTADYFYFGSSVIPSWMKDSTFKTKMRLNYDYPSQISYDRPIWSFQKSASTISTSNGSHGMAANATYLYWANYSGGKIQRCELDGSNLTDLVTGLTNPIDVAIDATTVYWSDYSAGKIQKAPIGGGSTTDLATGLTSPYGIDVDATDVYWSDYGTAKIQKVPVGGGSVTDIVTSGIGGIRGLTIDSTNIYFVLSSGYIKYVPLAGGTPDDIITSLSSLRSLTSDDYFLYWTSNSSDQVGCINKRGGNAVTLISETAAHAATVLSGAIYYAGSADIIYRVDTITAWLATDGKVKVIDGPDTQVETGAATASMHQDVEVEFDRVGGKVTLSGFTTGDGSATDTAWTSPDGYDVEWGCALGGAADIDGIITVPIKG